MIEIKQAKPNAVFSFKNNLLPLVLLKKRFVFCMYNQNSLIIRTEVGVREELLLKKKPKIHKLLLEIQ